MAFPLGGALKPVSPELQENLFEHDCLTVTLDRKLNESTLY